MQPDPSASLLVRVRARCPAAWQRLVELCSPVIVRWCDQAGLQDADVENVVQDIAAKLPAALPPAQDFERKQMEQRGGLQSLRLTVSKVGQYEPGRRNRRLRQRSLPWPESQSD